MTRINACLATPHIAACMDFQQHPASLFDLHAQTQAVCQMAKSDKLRQQALQEELARQCKIAAAAQEAKERLEARVCQLEVRLCHTQHASHACCSVASMDYSNDRRPGDSRRPASANWRCVCATNPCLRPCMRHAAVWPVKVCSNDRRHARHCQNIRLPDGPGYTLLSASVQTGQQEVMF
jgi:hypothetical protein